MKKKNLTRSLTGTPMTHAHDDLFLFGEKGDNPSKASQILKKTKENDELPRVR